MSHLIQIPLDEYLELKEKANLNKEDIAKKAREIYEEEGYCDVYLKINNESYSKKSALYPEFIYDATEGVVAYTPEKDKWAKELNNIIGEHLNKGFAEAKEKLNLLRSKTEILGSIQKNIRIQKIMLLCLSLGIALNIIFSILL